ncbi:hypothetical protein GCM10023238_11470 [Streptomyces heliomycini]
MDTTLLSSWQSLTGSAGGTTQAPLLYPVLVSEQGAIEALATYPKSIANYGPLITTGYDEGAAKKNGLIRWGNQTVPSSQM